MTTTTEITRAIRRAQRDPANRSAAAAAGVASTEANGTGPAAVDELASHPGAPPSLQELPLDLVDESPLNRRRHFDKAKFQELCDSVAKDGVLSPVLVRPISGGRFELAAGHRRRRAALQVKRSTIPAVVREMTDEQFLVTLVTENLQREDLHPLDEAQGYQDLLQLPGYDVEAVAARVGKSVSYVYQRLKLVELIPSAQKAFLDDKITAGHAVQIAREQPAEQAIALKFCLGETEIGVKGPQGFTRLRTVPSVRALAAFIQSEIHLDLHAASFPKDDAELLPAAGPCTTCPKRTGMAPELFGDIAKKDTCTDRTCFQAKAERFTTRQLATLDVKGKPAQVTTEYFADGVTGQVFTQGEWKKADPGSCAHVRPAQIVAGRGKGEVLAVCTDRGCAKHFPREQNAGIRRSPAELARAKRENLERDSKTAGRRALWDSVLEKLGADSGFKQGVPAPLLESVIAQFVARLWNDHAKLACRLLGLDVRKTRRYGYDHSDPGATLKAHAKGLAFDGRARFLVQLALVPHFERGNSYYTGDEKDQLALVARHYKLDPAKLIRAGAAAVKAKRQATQKRKPTTKRLAGDVRRARKAKAAR